MAFGKGNVLAVTAPLEYLINHVFLPPKTPQEDDINIEQEHNVISSLLLSVRMFSKVYQATESKKFSRVVRMLERLLRMKPGLEDINKAYAVKKVIEELKDGGMLISLTLFLPCFRPPLFQAPGLYVPFNGGF